MKKKIVKKKATPVKKSKATKKEVEKAPIPKEQKIVPLEEQVREVQGIAEHNDPRKHHSLREKYPDLSDEDIAGTNEEIAARVSAKIGVPYSDIFNAL